MTRKISFPPFYAHEQQLVKAARDKTYRKFLEENLSTIPVCSAELAGQLAHAAEKFVARRSNHRFVSMEAISQPTLTGRCSAKLISEVWLEDLHVMHSQIRSFAVSQHGRLYIGREYPGMPLRFLSLHPLVDAHQNIGLSANVLKSELLPLLRN